MPDLPLFLVNVAVAAVAFLFGMTFVAFLCGSCALFMLAVLGSDLRKSSRTGP